MQAGLINTSDADGGLLLRPVGPWTIDSAGRLEAELAAVGPSAAQSLRVDLGELEGLDMAGAWLLHRTVKRLAAEGVPVELVGGGANHRSLLEQAAANDHPPPAAPRPHVSLLHLVEAVGAWTAQGLVQVGDFLGFFGLVIETGLRTLVDPRRLRLTAMVHHMQAVGFNALPIVGLISFLIGVVLAYQGATQLRLYGAQVFIVNLVAVSVLRELGILLTSIVVAGRSGSAFAAQIGSMKLREEIDAMRTLGIDPVEALVLPRVLALLLTLPLLGFFSDLMGLLGGAVMSWGALDIAPTVFIQRLSDTNVWHFAVGLIKAPFFAVIIALIGCYEGLEVTGSAESVGQRTTRAVVEAIFLVIVTDAAFSIFFNIVDV
ncbi:MAG TPA: MlaE family lipid ABC transporter permease subunit [Candidatus Sulfotelmatobacter sp.]|nr:MlaE family lipid ABC transporter permease subunit [Candidatus Sulfotelmatobacter sp.]